MESVVQQTSGVSLKGTIKTVRSSEWGSHLGWRAAIWGEGW